MRYSRIALLIIILLVVVVGLLAARRSRPIEVKLADGSVLHFARIRYEKWRVPQVGGAWEKAKEKLRPIWLKWKYHLSLFGGSSTSMTSSHYTWHANEPALQIWITGTLPAPGPVPVTRTPIGADELVLVGEDGCVYPATQSGTAYEILVANNLHDATPVEVRWFTFEAIPRHDRQLRLRVYESGIPWKMIAEVTVPNPAPRPKEAADWVAQTLPARQANGDVTFALNSLTLKTNFSRQKPTEPAFNHPLAIVPALDVLDHGVSVTAPDALDLELHDSSGNFASKQFDNELFLSPKENFWKLRVKYFGVAPPDAESNSVWIIHNIKVPDPGRSSAINLTNQLRGVKISVIALVGAGTAAIYRNDALLSTAWTNGGTQMPSETWYSGIGPPVTDYSFYAPNGHVSLTISGMTREERVTVEMKDDTGMKYSSKPPNFSSGLSGEHFLFKPDDDRPVFLLLDAIPSGKTVDLTIRVHRPVMADFIVKPPTN